MYKYVGVYILVLMYNLFLCVTLEIPLKLMNFKIKKRYALSWNIFFAMKWMQIFYACINII